MGVMAPPKCEQKIYRVATFWHGEAGRAGRATGYLRDYNPSWAGCIIYEIAAQNGRDAVRLASNMRAEKERR